MTAPERASQVHCELITLEPRGLITLAAIGNFDVLTPLGSRQNAGLWLSIGVVRAKHRGVNPVVLTGLRFCCAVPTHWPYLVFLLSSLRH